MERRTPVAVCLSSLLWSGLIVENRVRCAELDRSGTPHWAFQQLGQPPLPRVARQDRVRTPIDAFILQKLEAKGLSFSPDADDARLARRVYFDLWGLPPSPAQLDDFLSDKAPGAYERSEFLYLE